MDDMQIFLCSEDKENKIYPLYVNEAGVDPNESEIGNEFILSHENLQTTQKNIYAMILIIINYIQFN